ncbi:MAG: hypothetical protein U1F67_04555 [Rubrivivax sp.]
MNLAEKMRSDDAYERAMRDWMERDVGPVPTAISEARRSMPSDRPFSLTRTYLYAEDRAHAGKHDAARLVARAGLRRCGRLSTQVLNEFYVNATRKLLPHARRRCTRRGAPAATVQPWA